MSNVRRPKVSPLTFWLSVAALVLVALFAVNAIVYRVRFGTFLRTEKRPALKGKLSKTEVALYMLMVLGLFVGYAVPMLAPTSSFGRWLLEPYSQAVYFVWCLLAVVVLNVALAICAHALRRVP